MASLAQTRHSLRYSDTQGNDSDEGSDTILDLAQLGTSELGVIRDICACVISTTISSAEITLHISEPF